jgi:hypothetical protein
VFHPVGFVNPRNRRARRSADGMVFADAAARDIDGDFIDRE